MSTRLPLNAALCDPPPHRATGTKGRPRLNGKRRPTLTVWTPVRVEQWYGEEPRNVEVATATALRYHAGKPTVAILCVLIRDPQKRFEPQALLSTNLAYTPEQMLTWFVRRWTMEVTFEAARTHLGMETQR